MLQLGEGERPPSDVTMNNLSNSHVTIISDKNHSSAKDLLEDENDTKEGNMLSRMIVCVREMISSSLRKHSQFFWLLFKTIINICLIIYIIAAVYHWYKNGQKPLDWCKGNGMLLLLTTFLAICIVYYKILTPLVLPYFHNNYDKDDSSTIRTCFSYLKRGLICATTLGLIIFLIVDTAESRRRLISAGGIVVFLFIGLIFSKHPNQIKWKTVLKGILLQSVIGLLVIRWDVGRAIFTCVGDRIDVFLKFGQEGATFVYGDYLINELQVFAFKALSVIFFLSMVIEICFYYGWMQSICFKLGSIIQMILGTTIIESVNAITTVFLGLSEAPLLFKPYIKDLTTSEMHAVMAGGFSTAAGTVFAAYTALGINPAYIITASLMAAPSALSFAKLLYPETEMTKTSIKTFIPYKSEERSVVDAACKGAISAVNLVMGIIAVVIACVSLVSFVDSLIVWFASMLGIEGFTFEYLVGKLLTPLPYIMGVSPDQCDIIARLIGIKITLNEFIAYKELGKLKKAKLLTPRSEAMATFALCSFSNPGGLGSFVAILIGLSPSQKHKVTKVALRAFISGITTGLLTASAAGALMPEEGFGECVSCITTTLMPNVTSHPS